MEKLKEIIQVVSRKRLKKIEVFNEGKRSGKRKNLYYRLYKGIKDGRFTTDEEAARALFDTNPSDKKYLMLKSRVKNRLLNNMFFLETASSPYQNSLYKSNRDLFAAKFLMINGARETAYSLLKSTYSEAKRFEFTEVSLQCLQLLRHYSYFRGQFRNYEDYTSHFHILQKQLQLEYLAEEYYQRAIMPFVRSSSPKPEMAEKVREYEQELEAKREDLAPSFLLKTYIYRLKAHRCDIERSHQELVDICDEAISYFDSREFPVQRIRYAEFSTRQMVGFLHLHDYEAGEKNANRALELLTEGTNNWMVFMEYYFLLAMHTGNYGKALDIYKKVSGNPRFNNLDPIRTEKWKIFEAFLRYMLSEVGAAQHSTHLENKFNIFKFLNEVPTFSRDKRGLNIAILILQILFLLDRKDFDGIISRTEALKVYCSRYLRKDENYRSNCFLKMLLAMERKDFIYEETRSVAEKYFRKLESARFSYRGNLSGLEIIPYEQLWKTILSKLDQMGQV